MSTSDWPFELDPKEKQRVPSTEGTMVGTCYYIAPEVILAAGWTIKELEMASEMYVDDLIEEDSS